MSRIGKKPIIIPSGVEVKIDGNEISVKGPKGELKRDIRPEIKIDVEGNNMTFAIKAKTKNSNAFWGLTRMLVSNMVQGVSEGYKKELQIEGVGYRAELTGHDLVLRVGYSHPVTIKQPEGIEFSIEKNIITINGIDKQLVGQIAAEIRDVRPPEPYKGKGIRYVGEIVRKKAGKKVVAGG